MANADKTKLTIKNCCPYKNGPMRVIRAHVQNQENMVWALELICTPGGARYDRVDVYPRVGSFFLSYRYV